MKWRKSDAGQRYLGSSGVARFHRAAQAIRSVGHLARVRARDQARSSHHQGRALPASRARDRRAEHPAYRQPRRYARAAPAPPAAGGDGVRRPGCPRAARPGARTHPPPRQLRRRG